MRSVLFMQVVTGGLIPGLAHVAAATYQRITERENPCAAPPPAPPPLPAPVPAPVLREPRAQPPASKASSPAASVLDVPSVMSRNRTEESGKMSPSVAAGVLPAFAP